MEEGLASSFLLQGRLERPWKGRSLSALPSPLRRWKRKEPRGRGGRASRRKEKAGSRGKRNCSFSLSPKCVCALCMCLSGSGMAFFPSSYPHSPPPFPHCSR